MTILSISCSKRNYKDKNFLFNAQLLCYFSKICNLSLHKFKKHSILIERLK